MQSKGWLVTNLMVKHHDALIKPRQFNVGDLVLKRVSLATKDPTHEKLGPNWEGPYRVINSKRHSLFIWRLWMDEGWSTHGMWSI